MIPDSASDGPSRPLLLLDVDGVINAVARQGDRSVWPADQWIRRSVQAQDAVYPILASRAVLSFLILLHERGAAEIRWHTTWQDWARSELAPALGLPDWAVADAPEFTHRSDSGYERLARDGGTTWWKLAAVERALLEDGRRVVWADDDLHHQQIHNSDLQTVLGSDLLLAVSPRGTVGLTPKDLAAIAAFLGIETPAFGS